MGRLITSVTWMDVNTRAKMLTNRKTRKKQKGGGADDQFRIGRQNYK